MTPDVSSPFFAAPAGLAGPHAHQSTGVVTGTASNDSVLVIGSMAAAQTGQYQNAVQEAGMGGQRQVEMHMADRLTDGGECPSSDLANLGAHFVLGLLAYTTSTPAALLRV